MSYYNSKVLNSNFEKVEIQVRESLQNVGFGILTEIDIQQKLNEKLAVEFHKYKILGACNPKFAYEALKFDSRIGTMLPCNVIIQELNDGKIEVAAINPIASMSAVNNEDIERVATEVSILLNKFIASLTD
jgi:uncharacterized protein (DUF302 family)